jgi:hypothetical protein
MGNITREDFRKAVQALKLELDARSLPTAFRRTTPRIKETNTSGWSAIFGTLGSGRAVELWADHYLARRERIFWFGFRSYTGLLSDLIEPCRKELKPKCLSGKKLNPKNHL